MQTTVKRVGARIWKRVAVFWKHVPVWAPPIVGVVYFVTWVVTEWGRSVGSVAIVFAMFAVAIGIAKWQPLASLAILVLVPTLQILGLVYPPSGTSWPAYGAAALVAFLVGFSGPRRPRYLALVIGAVAVALFAYRLALPSRAENSWSSWTGMIAVGRLHPLQEDFLTLLLAGFGIYAAAWALGVGLANVAHIRRISRVLISAETRLEETDFELRLAQDRERISRDVHDALAHSLAIVVSQAEGALALRTAKPEVVGDSLRNIATVSRTALVDVRRLVEQIQEDDDVTTPKATIADIEALITHLREIGMDASLRVFGDRAPLMPSQELAVYRIVQESLTNSLKHGGPTGTVTVVLDWRGPGLAVLATSAGGTPLIQERVDPDRGIGVAGMKERARLAGGWLTAGLSGDGSFIVTAFIPTHDGSSATAGVPGGAAADGAAAAPAGAPDETGELVDA
jgi:signal transduction histidine kinase